MENLPAELIHSIFTQPNILNLSQSISPNISQLTSSEYYHSYCDSPPTIKEFQKVEPISFLTYTSLRPKYVVIVPETPQGYHGYTYQNGNITLIVPATHIAAIKYTRRVGLNLAGEVLIPSLRAMYQVYSRRSSCKRINPNYIQEKLLSILDHYKYTLSRELLMMYLILNLEDFLGIHPDIEYLQKFISDNQIDQLIDLMYKDIRDYILTL